MHRLVIYIHGKGGSADEAKHYIPLFPDHDVVGFDYKSDTPWEAAEEFSAYFDEVSHGYDEVVLIAVSIGAYFSVGALADKKIDQAFFISPVADMEKLIKNMMTAGNVTEEELREKREIPTVFGETLSWDYLCYVRSHPVNWNIPTHIIYGSNDELISYDAVKAFAKSINASLSVMEGAVHWFHTDAQMAFIDETIKKYIKERYYEKI